MRDQKGPGRAGHWARPSDSRGAGRGSDIAGQERPEKRSAGRLQGPWKRGQQAKGSHMFSPASARSMFFSAARNPVPRASARPASCRRVGTSRRLQPLTSRAANPFALLTLLEARRGWYVCSFFKAAHSPPPEVHGPFFLPLLFLSSHEPSVALASPLVHHKFPLTLEAQTSVNTLPFVGL